MEVLLTTHNVSRRRTRCDDTSRCITKRAYFLFWFVTLVEMCGLSVQVGAATALTSSHHWTMVLDEK